MEGGPPGSWALGMSSVCLCMTNPKLGEKNPQTSKGQSENSGKDKQTGPLVALNTSTGWWWTQVEAQKKHGPSPNSCSEQWTVRAPEGWVPMLP